MNEKQRLRGLDRTYVSSNDRESLLNSGDGKSYGRESEMTRDMNTQQLVDRSAVEMKQQDEMLDVMSRGLDNLKGMGIAIRDETTLQVVRARPHGYAASSGGSLAMLNSELPVACTISLMTKSP